MFAPHSRSLRRPDSTGAGHALVEELHVDQPREPRSRRCELVLAIGWVLVLAKSAAVWWLCEAYPEVKISAWWVIIPTWMFASLCTVLYWRRD